MLYCEKVLRVGTCKYPLNIVSFQVRSVLAARQKIWSYFLQTLCFFHIVLLVILMSICELSPVLAEVQ